MREEMFTEGPWEAVEVNKGEALIVQPCDTSKQPICLVDRVPNAWDNARLIAAAPEMYAALKKLAERVIVYFPKGKIERYLDCDIEVRQFARDALVVLDKAVKP